MLSKTAKYGLKTIMHLAKNSGNHRKYNAEELAGSLKIPKHFLSRILYDLSKQKIISSQKGPGGGFYLSEDQLNLNPYDAIRSLEGEDFLNVCIFEQQPCIHDKPCVFHNIYSEYKKNFIFEMSEKCLGEYAEELKT